MSQVRRHSSSLLLREESGRSPGQGDGGQRGGAGAADERLRSQLNKTIFSRCWMSRRRKTGGSSQGYPTRPSPAVLCMMQLTLHPTRPTPHGVSCLVQAISAWSVKAGRAPSRHCRGARVFGHTINTVSYTHLTLPTICSV